MSNQRVLLVQCCHLPQFFYVARTLHQQHPQWEIEALVTSHSRIRHYLKILPRFHRVYFLGQDSPEIGDIDRLVYPLLNRGYWKIKRVAHCYPLPEWEVDYQGDLRPLRTDRLYRSFFAASRTASPDFARYYNEFPHPPLGRSILLLESCHPSLLEQVKQRLDQLIPANAQLLHLQKTSTREVWNRARSCHPDSAVVFFSGEKGFAWMKLIPFLLRVSRVLVVDENGRFFYCNARSLVRFLADRFLHGASPPEPEPRILFVQTENPGYVRQALEKLRQEKLFPRSEVMLLCRQQDRQLFEDNSEVDRIITYASRNLRTNLQLRRELQAFDADLTCAIFSGRPSFKRPKLLFFLLPIRRHLVFNASLDSYELTPRTFFRIFRREPLAFEDALSGQKVLLLQTDYHEKTTQAISVIRSRKVAPNARISILCHQDLHHVFRGIPEVQKVFTYDPKNLYGALRVIWQLARSRYDVVAALFSEQPVFRKQKLLFFLLPARSHLVLNANLDCFYLNWHTFWWFLTRQAWGTIFVFRKLVRIFFFIPRFAYLLIWLTLMNLTKARGRPVHREQ